MRISLTLISLAMMITIVSCEDNVTLRPFKPMVEGRLIYNAVCYGPHRDGQRPGANEPSADEFLDDLHLILPRWKLIRVYGSSEFAGMMLTVIRDNKLDIKVMLGAWIAAEGDSTEAAASNIREVDAAIRLANEFPSIVAAVSVGNEALVSWSDHRIPLDIMIGYVKRVREGVGVPVTVADDFNFWNKPESRELSSQIDFITLHAHPMWNGLQLDEALDWTKERLAEIQAFHPGRTIVIGETGWATSVHNEGQQSELIKGIPGEAGQKEFYDAVRAWASTERKTVFFFEAFDENWKGGEHPADVEKHWGLFRADRSPKAAIASKRPTDRGAIQD